MRLTWHIFFKDARRLWWEITVTLAVLAILAREDQWRSDYTPGPVEGLLSLLLAAAWAYLIALAIHQEPIVGDRQFWITRPYPRSSLAGAKALFAAAFILVPSLIADFAILSLRGFSPIEHLGPLLWKQVALCGALVLPAAALAAITATIGQFLAVSVALAGATALLQQPQYPWRPSDPTRQVVVVVVLAVGAAVVLLLQYTRRHTALSRTTGAATVAAAAMLFLYLPNEFTFRLECAAAGDSVQPLSVRFAPDALQPLPPRFSVPGQFVAAVPIQVDRLVDSTRVSFETLEFEVELPDREPWRLVAAGARQRDRPPAISGGIYFSREGGSWFMIQVSRPALEQFRAERVTVRGKLAARLHREGVAVAMPVGERGQLVPGLGRCSNFVLEEPFGRMMLKVICESPRPLPLPSQVRLSHADRQWLQSLGSSVTSVSYPAWTPFSPLHRKQTFFHITHEALSKPGSQYMVPREALTGAIISITPHEPAGCAVTTFELRDLDLRPYALANGP